MDTVGFLVVLAISVSIALAGDNLAPGIGPFRWAIAILMGVMGSIIGTALMGGWGPALAGVFLFPAALGATVFVGLFELACSVFVPRPSPR